MPDPAQQQKAVDNARATIQNAGALPPAAIEAIIQAILTVVQAFIPAQHAEPQQPQRR